MKRLNQSQEDSEEIEKKEELKKIRVMLFSAMISYPLWGLLAKYVAPNAYDPIWQRLLMSVLAGSLSTYTLTKRGRDRNYHSEYFICWLYTYHLLFLYWMNADTPFYLMSNLIQFPYMVLAFPNKKHAQVYAYTMMVTSILFSLFVPYHTMNPWLYTLGILTLGHFLITLVAERFNVVDELKRSKELLKTRQEQKLIEHAHQAMTAKLASMFTIAGGVAHEINNPLGIVIARLQNLKKKIISNEADQEQTLEVLQKTITTAHRIAKIVTGLKALSNPSDDYPMVQVPLKEIIKDSLVLFEENFKQLNINLIVDDIPTVTITCKKAQIQQIILNLLENARDAVSDVNDKWVRISFREDDENISIAIYDSGIIHSEEVKKRMMEPFYTTKDIGKGAGLGLSISKALIESHEGELFLDPDSHHTGLIIKLKKTDHSEN